MTQKINDKKAIETAQKMFMKDVYKTLIENNKEYLDSEYYHKVDTLDVDYLSEISDSIYADLEKLKSNPNQYIFLAFFGDPITQDKLISIHKSNKESWDDENGIVFHCESSLKDTFKDVSDDWGNHEPIYSGYLHEYVILACLNQLNNI